MKFPQSLKNLSIFIGLVLVVLVVRYNYTTLPVSSEEIALVNDTNNFAKAGFELGEETGITPEIDILAQAAGAFSEGGKEVFGWETNKRWPIASLTKLMTAVIALEHMDTNQIAIMSPEAMAIESPSGGFSLGWEYRINDLIRAMLLVSSNDAAEQIALTFGRDEFIKAMNGKALELGMTETNFIDPTGLSARNQSTINDLVRLTEYIRLFRPEMLATTKKTSGTITEVKTGKRRTLNNINPLASGKDFIGGKTGSTPEAGGNLISVFNIGGGPKIIIILGADDKFAETTKVKNSLWQ